MKFIRLAPLALALLIVSAVAQRPASASSSTLRAKQVVAQPAVETALPDDAVLRARVAKIAADRRKSLRDDQKAANEFFVKYEKRRVKAMPHVNTPEYLAADAMSNAAAQVAGPFAAEERLFIDFEDTRSPVRELIPLVIAQAVKVQRAIAAVPQRQRTLEQTAAVPRSRVAGLLPDYKEALARELHAMRQQTITFNGVLAALQQGGPADYQASYEKMIADARESARQHQARLDAQEAAFGRVIADTFVGIVGFSALAASSGKLKSCSTEQTLQHASNEVSRQTACRSLPHPGTYQSGLCPFEGFCIRVY